MTLTPSRPTPGLTPRPAHAPAETGVAANRRRWDARARIHVEDRTGFYGVDAFRRAAGPEPEAFDDLDRAALGPVEGLRIAHLQCHFGLDTLRLERLGARPEGLDFSPVAIAAARRLAAEAGLSARFHEADVRDAAAVMGPARFDLVFVTWGAMSWLPELTRWAGQAAALLVPGGRLFLQDAHPAAEQLDLTARGLVPSFDWRTPADAPLRFHDPATYTGDDAPLPPEPDHNWIHPISDIVTALLSAGLEIRSMSEHDTLVWDMWPGLTEKGPDGLWRLPEGHVRVPLSLTVTAAKPA